MFVTEKSQRPLTGRAPYFEELLRKHYMLHFPLAIGVSLVTEDGTTESQRHIHSVQELADLVETAFLPTTRAMTVVVPPGLIVLFYHTRDRPTPPARRDRARGSGHFLFPAACPHKPMG